VSVALNFNLPPSKQLSIRVVHIARATARRPLGLSQALLPLLLMWTYAGGILIKREGGEIQKKEKICELRLQNEKIS
jgi:hypothetical protein